MIDYFNCNFENLEVGRVIVWSHGTEVNSLINKFWKGRNIKPKDQGKYKNKPSRLDFFLIEAQKTYRTCKSNNNVSMVSDYMVTEMDILMGRKWR